MVIVNGESEGEETEDVVTAKEDDTLLIVTENGYGKRTAVSAYRSQKRGGKGIIAIGKSKRNGAVVAAKRVADIDELVLISSSGYVTRNRSRRHSAYRTKHTRRTDYGTSSRRDAC